MKMFLKRLTSDIYLPSIRYLTTLSKSYPVLPDSFDSNCPQIKEATLLGEENVGFLRKLTAISKDGGGEKGRYLHKEKNKKLTVRERLNGIFDDNSETFEINTLAGLGLPYGDIPGATMATVIGKIHNTYCIAIGSDATLKGGTYFPITVTKANRALDISKMIRLPSLHLVDSGGGFLPLQSEIFPDKNHGGRTFYNEAILSSLGIPQLSIVCGSCTAGGAYAPSMCEENIIVDGIGTVFLAGPPLVKASTGETVTAEELGGATTHTVESGVSDYFAKNEEESFEMLKDSFSTLNITEDFSINWIYDDHPLYSMEDLTALSGKKSLNKTDMLNIISRIADGSRFRQFKEKYGQNLITGYARIYGQIVGILSNYGPLTYKDALKGSHFIQVCEHREIPLVFLQNSGNIDDVRDFNEKSNPSDIAITLKARATMAATVATCTVDKFAINIAGCHLDDNYTMCGPAFGSVFSLSWPNASILTGFDKLPERENKLSKFTFARGSSWHLASHGLIDGIIEPMNTRETIGICLKISKQKDRIKYRPKKFSVLRL